MHCRRGNAPLTRGGFFIEAGRTYGLEYEMLRAYERELNRGLSSREIPITMVFAPVPFNQLVPALQDGRGDIVAAGVTVTRDRCDGVAFSTPYIDGVREVVVGNRQVALPERSSDLSGKEVHVVP